jgi:hypothetical protein
VAAGALAAVMLAGALPINEYYRLAWQNGGARNWTDAIYRLYAYVRTTPETLVVCNDWGIMDQLRLLGRGRLPLTIIYDAVPPEGGAPDAHRVAAAVGDPDHLFIGHTKDFEFFQSGEVIVKDVEAEGYRKEMLGIIPDSWGRPVYEVYHFVK